MPSWNILVTQSGCDIEHDNRTLPMDVVSVPQASKLLLACCVPTIESNWPAIREEIQGAYIDTNRGFISFLKFTSEMTFHKGGLPSASVAYDNQLEAWVINWLSNGRGHSNFEG